MSEKVIIASQQFVRLSGAASSSRWHVLYSIDCPYNWRFESLQCLCRLALYATLPDSIVVALEHSARSTFSGHPTKALSPCKKRGCSQ